MPFNLASVDWANPSAFYLGDPDLAELGDVTVKHSGLELPAHSHILAQQSGVLKDLFRLLRGPSSGEKRKRGAEGPVELETPFVSFRLQETALFLRFVYRPRDVNDANLEQAVPHLAGVTRLAHSLDSSSLLGLVDSYLCSKMQGDGAQEAALQWLPVAEECQLDAAWEAGVRELANGILSGQASLLPALEGVQRLAQKLRPSTIAAVLAAVTAAAGQASEAWKQQAAGHLPSPGIMLAWQSPGMQQASYTWRIADFRQQSGRLLSSEVFGGSGLFRLEIHPNGFGEARAGHVSFFLESCGLESVVVKCRLEIVDQVDNTAEYIFEFTKEFNKPKCSWGNPKLASRADLDAKADRYLVDGAAVFRAHVTWLEKRALPVGDE